MSILVTGIIKKKTFCPNCFSNIEWDTPNLQHTHNGYRYITCPICGNDIPIDDRVTIEQVNETVSGTLNGSAVNASEAIKSLKPGDILKLSNDVDATAITSIAGGEIDLNGKSINLTEKGVIAAFNGSNFAIKNGVINMTKDAVQTQAIYAVDGSTVTLDNVTINNPTNSGITVAKNATVKLNNCRITTKQATFLTADGGEGHLVINGGNYTSTDSPVVMANGSTNMKHNTYEINGGTFNSYVETEGDIGCGVYAPNDDTFIIKGDTTINVPNGVGILVRGGRVDVAKTVQINVGGTGEGIIGDVKINIPAGKQIVIDYKANYPEAKTIKVSAEGKDITEIKAE